MLRRSFPQLAGILTLCVAALAARPAEAKCAYPRAFFSEPVDARVPANPVVYLFAPGMFAKKAQAGGGPTIKAVDEQGRSVPVRTHRVSHSQAFDTYRVSVKIAAPNRVTVSFEDTPRWAGKAVTATYEVVPIWRPPAAEPVKILKSRTEASRWTCSYQQSRNLSLATRAMAVQVEWARTAADFHAGKREILVLPPSMNRFFNRPKDPAQVEPVLELGHVNCTGHTFEFKGRPIVASIRALRADGSTTNASATPHLVAPSR